MYTTRTLDGWSDLFDPAYRKVYFADKVAMVVMSTHLRYAWTALPGQDTSPTAVLQFIKANYQRSEEERKEVPQNPDKESIRNPWRESIYYHWNHVFCDVMEFLTAVGLIVGHFHLPSHDVFAVPYPKSNGDDQNATSVLKRVWSTNVLIIPTYLEPNVTIRVSYIHTESGEKALGTFDESNTTEIWYIRSGVEINMFVEGNYEQNRQGVAAVFVCGIACSENHYEEDDDNQDAS